MNALKKNLNLALLPIAAAATMLMAAPAHALTVTGSNSLLASDGTAIVNFTFDTEGEQIDFAAFDLLIEYDSTFVLWNPTLIAFTPIIAIGTLVPDFENHGTSFPGFYPGGLYLSWSIDDATDVQSAKGTGVLSLGFTDVALLGGSTNVNLSLSYATVDMGDQSVQGLATISAVPEPSPLALLLAGAGVVGAVARRRRAH